MTDEQIKYLQFKKKFDSIFAKSFLYLFLFSPYVKILGHLSLIPFFYSILAISQNKEWNLFFRNFKSEMLFLTIIFAYCFVISFSGSDFKPLVNVGRIALIGFLPAFYFSHFCVKSKLDFYKLIEEVTIIAASFSLILFLIPWLNSFIKLIFVFESISDNAIDENRGFGITSNHYFGYAVGLGIGFALIIERSMRSGNHLKMLFLPVILFAIVINARVGLIPIILYFLIKLFKHFTFRKLIIFLLSIVLFYYLLVFLRERNILSKLVNNILLLFDATIDLILYGNLVTGNFFHYKYLFDYFLIYPNQVFEWIFGLGQDVFHGIYYKGHIRNSDVGYIRQIFYGGITYVLLWVTFASNLYKRSKKYVMLYKIQYLEYIPLLLLLTILITNIKGLSFAPNVALNFVLILYVYIIIMGQQQKEQVLLSKNE